MKFDDDGWLDEAIEIDVLDKSMSRYGYRASHICIHGTAGGVSAQSIANYFQTSQENASTHFIVGKDGVIVQCVPCSLAAWGNGVLTTGHAPFLPENINPNYYTISIEHVKSSTDNSDNLTTAQKEASFQLIKAICDFYKIPKKRAVDMSGGILYHADIDPINRARCPGPYPLEELLAFLGESGMKVYGPNSTDFDHWFIDHTDHWSCKQNGMTILGACLQFYRQLSVDGNTLPLLGLPQSNELYERSKDNILWSIQLFERGVLVYDPSHVVDSQPGCSSVYLAKLSTALPYLTPTTTIPTKLMEDIKKIIEDSQNLQRDSGL